MTNNRYNGWTNQATWRVNMELINDLDPRDLGWSHLDRYDLSDAIRNYVDQIFSGNSQLTILDYTFYDACIADVNWREIAEHMMMAYADEY